MTQIVAANVLKMAGPSNESLLALFIEIETALLGRLEAQTSWGLSGQRDGQYVHDLVADELIVGRLRQAGLGVLSEESGSLEGGEAATGITVVVDPIDGSTNASHGLPWYALSLCAVDAQGPVVALVTNLALGIRYRATRGGGAWRESCGPGDQAVKLNPSDVDTLPEAMLSFSGWPPAHGGWRQYRTYGACALDLCAVAEGTFDAFVDVDSAHGVWDYLGGLLVCQEAGAQIVDGTGRDLVVLDHGQRRAPVAAAQRSLLNEVLAMRASWQ